jgi:hypothetical protein
MKRKILALCTLSISICSLVFGCSSTPKTYVLPTKDQYQGYKIIDAVDKNTVFTKVNLDDNEKLAVVMRDISTTAYSFIEPRYMNSMVHYDGKSQCCLSAGSLIGTSGLIVYKFSFIGKGNTAIKIIARQKGLSTTVDSFETDHLVTINVESK